MSNRLVQVFVSFLCILCTFFNTSFAGDVIFKNRLSTDISVAMRRQNTSNRAYKSNWFGANQSTNVFAQPDFWHVEIFFRDGTVQSFKSQYMGNAKRTEIVFQQQTRQVPKTVTTFVNRRKVMPDGTVRIVKEPVQQTRMETMVILSADISDSNGVQIPLTQVDSGSSGGFRTGVTVHRCESGIHIDRVDPNGPASRTMDANGTVFALEKDDHIVAINGNRAVSVQRFKEMSSRGQPFSIDVKDRQSGVVRRLKIRPSR